MYVSGQRFKRHHRPRVLGRWDFWGGLIKRVRVYCNYAVKFRGRGLIFKLAVGSRTGNMKHVIWLWLTLRTTSEADVCSTGVGLAIEYVQNGIGFLMSKGGNNPPYVELYVRSINSCSRPCIFICTSSYFFLFLGIRYRYL